MAKRLATKTTVQKRAKTATKRAGPTKVGKKPIKAKLAKATLVSKAKVKPLTPNPGRTGFMWKVLEQKQKALQQTHGVGKHPFDHANGNGANSPKAQKGFGRFAGPRRRAA